jgi:hypothetical protein
MIERTGSIFDPAELSFAMAVLIPTNGRVNTRGLAVMGAGVALQASMRWLGIAKTLGAKLRAHGNLPHYLGARGAGEWITDAEHYTWADACAGLGPVTRPCAILSFPTKDHWNGPASLDLIQQSAEVTRNWVDAHVEPGAHVILPRVGVGCGRLDWALVRPILAASFDDRFHVLTPPERP